jgi:hypothetical protein
VLRANKRILKPGGTLAFVTIEVAPTTDRRRKRRAASVGPPAVATSSNYPCLLRSAGLVEIERIDLTEEYQATALAWFIERQRRADSFTSEFGEEALTEQTTIGQQALDAIADGVLRRVMYVARRR